MPLSNKTKEEILNKIKAEQNPSIKIQLIALYHHLTQIYSEDDKFDQITRVENYDYHQKLRDQFFRGIAIIRGEIPVSV